jgi:hypothetical protein
MPEKEKDKIRGCVRKGREGTQRDKKGREGQDKRMC